MEVQGPVEARGAGAGHILVVDGDRLFRLATAELLRRDGHDVDVAEDAAGALALLEAEAFDLVVLGTCPSGAEAGSPVEVLRTPGLRVPVLKIGGRRTIDAAGPRHEKADHVLPMPFDPEALTTTVTELVERRRAVDQFYRRGLRTMVGRSRAMQEVFEAVRRVAPTEATVLITGETGTGKEMLARALHDLSGRVSGPFLPVSCTALADGTLESELFGHVRGAFTGAVTDRTGLFAAARGGTIFLDEVGDLGTALQQRLLRALEEWKVTPVGAVQPIPVDVRIVAATRRNLGAEVGHGRFREDLHYRLSVFPIAVPPLRERVADIPPLVEAALRRVRQRSVRPDDVSFSPLAIRLLRAYDWPGNVRELFSVVESAALRAGGARIRAEHLPARLRDSRRSGAAPGQKGQYRATSPEDERNAIVAALEEAGGVRTRAAYILGMSRTTLWRRMKEFGLGEG
jgi:DNA-binding NtrC family response regulator